MSGGLCLASSLSLENAVQVGGSSLKPTLVAEALNQCRSHEAKLDAEECLRSFWVPRWLLDREAAESKLDVTAGLRYAKSEFLQEKLTRVLSQKMGTPDDSSVNAYLTKNQRDFEKPLRIRVFRILLASAEDAQKLIKQLGSATSIQDFRRLTREYSVDAATHERGGDLGFLWPNGSTDVPQVSCDKALYRAALLLKDGELSQKPIVEGKRFAVIWRRGSKPAIAISETSRKIARLRLLEEATEKELQTLLSRLKEEGVKERKNIILGKLRRKEATLFKEP